MKLYYDNKSGTIYWENFITNNLMFAPMPIDGKVNTRTDGGEVDFDCLEKEDKKHCQEIAKQVKR
jgi:hypothetical protein